MASYIRVPFEADPSTIERRVYDYIQEEFPAFAPRPGHALVIQTEAFAEAISELLQLASDVPEDIFMYLGTLFGVVPNQAKPATTTVEIVLRHTDGYVVPEGLAFRLPIGGEEYAGFETNGPAIVPSGQDAVTGVIVTAIEEGTRSNGLGGVVATQDLIDIDINVLSITTEADTEGGVDPQDVDEYMEKFATRLQLLKDGVVRARDVELYLMSHAEVSRAKAIDNYDPGVANGGVEAVETETAEKTISWTALDLDGAEVVDPLRAELLGLLEPTREVNFNFIYLSPDFNDVTIECEFSVNAGFELAAAEASVEAALESYFNPLIFNSTDYHNAPEEWVNRDTLRYLEVATVINNVSAVNEIDLLEINGVAGDLALTGKIPLISPNPTLTLTATL